MKGPGFHDPRLTLCPGVCSEVFVTAATLLVISISLSLHAPRMLIRVWRGSRPEYVRDHLWVLSAFLPVIHTPTESKKLLISKGNQHRSGLFSFDIPMDTRHYWVKKFLISASPFFPTIIASHDRGGTL